jgi:hypothetical protein
MNLPTKTAKKRDEAVIADIHAKLRSRRPMRSPGVLTTHTTQGVTRRAASGTGGGGGGGAARWA